MFLRSDFVSEVSARCVEGSVRETETESINGDVRELSSVNGRKASEEGSVVCTGIEAATGIDPDVLVVALEVDEGWSGSGVLSEVQSIIGVNIGDSGGSRLWAAGVVCHFYINNYYKRIYIEVVLLIKSYRGNQTLVLNSLRFPMVDEAKRAPLVGWMRTWETPPFLLPTELNA